jgi:hypothetical protein
MSFTDFSSCAAAPAAFCRNARASAISGRDVTTIPPMLSLWPFKYFVVLWTTISAPSASGRWTNGPENVLSTTSVTS